MRLAPPGPPARRGPAAPGCAQELRGGSVLGHREGARAEGEQVHQLQRVAAALHQLALLLRVGVRVRARVRVRVRVRFRVRATVRVRVMVRVVNRVSEP